MASENFFLSFFSVPPARALCLVVNTFLERRNHRAAAREFVQSE